MLVYYNMIILIKESLLLEVIKNVSCFPNFHFKPLQFKLRMRRLPPTPENLHLYNI